ncbi:ABC transporter permease [Carnobacterium gallinarum]|uniref:ABC transporter permease n=1 Tax=Carnobacterium gallinarum TaxID=2749 RepID=UPI00055786DA|nr:ABC transporter permease subunit [Carnobacterium gallinarum]
MSNLIVLVRKEWKQSLRDYKLLWLPIVFIILGITQPLMIQFLPEILKSMGNAEGLQIDVVKQSGASILSSTYGQFDQIGMIILVVSMMGVVYVEKANGMLDFILTRPVSATTYIWSKYLGQFSIVILALGLGYLGSIYYTLLYYSTIPVKTMVVSFSLYLLWIVLVFSIIVCFSTLLNGQGGIAVCSLVVSQGLKIISSFDSMINKFNPAMLSNQAVNVLLSGKVADDLFWQVGVLCIFLLGVLVGTTWFIGNKKYSIES